MKTEIKACPFCGTEAYPPELCSKAGARKQYKLGCKLWCVSMIRSTQEACIRDWNQRYIFNPNDVCKVVSGLKDEV